jgi:chromosome partitioning protein
MGKIIAIANQKGGVGKTTTAVNLCAALTELGVNTLLCDMDPQGNATSGLGVRKDKSATSIYNVLIENVDTASAIVKTNYCDLLPANQILSGAGIELIALEEREYILKKALSDIRNWYDYIIIDCPPSLEMLTLNSLCAADSVLVPVQCEYFALEGLSDLMSSIKMTKKALNPALTLEGVVLTMYDARTNFSSQVAAEIKKFFKEKTFSTVIPRSIRVAEAPSHGKTVLDYDRSSRGAGAYIELGKEILNRNAGGRRA